MTKTEVLDLLKENRDARGEANWQAVGDRTGGLTSFGIGLTKLRAIAKPVRRDHDLALRLWNERNHDAKIIGLLIDDPKELTRDQVEKQVIGTAEASLHHHPEVWRDWGSREDVLQHLKQLWHVLVHYGVPAHRTTDDFLGD